MIRFTNGKNPLGLYLGETVKFDKIATIEYRDVGSELKTLEFEEKSGQGVVVGVCYKCEGERIQPYEESEGFGSYTVGPKWVTHKRHLFYQVKTCLHAKDSYLVSPAHIRLLT